MRGALQIDAHKADHMAGITPIIMRRAAYYMTLGVGEYFPDHPHYDRVTVEPLYELTPNPENDMEWSMGISVNFFKHNRRTRWIEFGCRTTGAGGDSILREVSDG